MTEKQEKILCIILSLFIVGMFAYIPTLINWDDIDSPKDNPYQYHTIIVDSKEKVKYPRQSVQCRMLDKAGDYWEFINEEDFDKVEEGDTLKIQTAGIMIYSVE